MKISPDYDIAILGGGLAGLTAALYAARAGHAVAVFEKGPHAGGRATTQETDGYYFNQGLTPFTGRVRAAGSWAN
ncbi:MAG TPA: FAD-dependent oxidoreductase [Prosthecobacter sp.]